MHLKYSRSLKEYGELQDNSTYYGNIDLIYHIIYHCITLLYLL